MSDNLHNSHAQKLLYLMTQSFNQDEIDNLFFDLGIDVDGVSKPANKQKYIEYLLRFMASRNSQRALTARLKNIRPHTDWPHTYTVPIDINTQGYSKQLHFEQHVREQHINIYANPRTSGKTHTYKSRSASKEKELQRIKDDVFESIFKHTLKFAWFLLIISISFGIGLTALFFVYKEFIIDSGLWIVFLILILGLLNLLSKVIFRYIFQRIRKSTKFYDLSVNDRVKVKEALLNTEVSRNKFMDSFCVILISFFLETNLNQANKRKR